MKAPQLPLDGRDSATLDPWWSDGAMRAVQALASTGRVFSADDVRDDPYNLPDPPHPSQWGALFSAAASAGLIEHAGFATSRNPTRRGGVLRTWRGKAGAP